jgi:hypothetical protein
MFYLTNVTYAKSVNTQAHKQGTDKLPIFYLKCITSVFIYRHIVQFELNVIYMESDLNLKTCFSVFLYGHLVVLTTLFKDTIHSLWDSLACLTNNTQLVSIYGNYQD